MEHGFRSGRLVSQAVLSQTPKLSCNGLVSIHLPRASLHVVSWSPNRMWDQSCLHSLGLSALLPLLPFTLMGQMQQQVHEQPGSSTEHSGSSHFSPSLPAVCFTKICWWSNTNYFIKSQSSLHIFPIFWEMSISHFHHIENLIVCRVGCMSSELATILMEYWFYLKEWLTYKLLLFWVWSLVGIFSKMIEANLSFQQKQLAVFVANDGIWAFKWKWEFGNFVHTLESLTVSP